MWLYLAAFIAGILTILAPCVLPVLPVILGGWLVQWQTKRILIICASFIVSIVAFTLLLKVSTVCTWVNPRIWSYISGAILIVFGLISLFPRLRENFSVATWLYKSQNLLNNNDNSVWWNILLGAALGPVFSSCSPTYAVIIALILPVSIWKGSISVFLYALWLWSMLFLVARGWSAVVRKLRWASSPTGRFKKIIGILIILTGVAIVTDYTKVIQTKLLDLGLYTNMWWWEQKITDSLFDMDEMNGEETTGTVQEDIDTSLLNANYPAPNLTWLETWLNTTGISSIADLSGKVVVVDFWTYSCINCIRTLPYLKQRNEKYKDDGLVIIGIHAPEFQFEKDPKNVIQALKKYDITYPVALDNDFNTRKAFKNRYRPAKYIIDVKGHVRYKHFGEWNYAETEKVIQELLKQVPWYTPDHEQMTTEIIKPTNDDQTAETYMGLSRRALYPVGKQAYFLEENKSVPNTRWLQGEWKADDEKVTLQASAGSVWLQYNAADAILVAGTARWDVEAKVYLDGKLYKTMTIKDFGAYTLVEWAEIGDHTIEVKFDKPGIELYTFTFG